MPSHSTYSVHTSSDVADHVVHRRKNRLSRHAILGCVRPDDEAKVGATLVMLLFEVASSVWGFASLTPDAIPRGAGDGIAR